MPPQRTSSEVLLTISGLLLSVLVFTGLFAYHAILILPSPSSPYPQPTDSAVLAYRNLLRSLAWLSVAAMDLAVALSVGLPFLLGAKGTIAEGVRRGLFTFAAVLFLTWTLFSAVFFFSVRYLMGN